MTMTRTQYEHTCAVKAGIIHALRDNLGDEFSAKEIAASMAWPSDLEPMQVGAILKSMVAEGLVTRRRQHDGNLYQLHKRALAWTPPEYDWRVARSNPVAKTKPPAAGKVNGAPVLVPPATPARKKPKPPASKPADDHPWVHPPAVTKDKPDRGGITRPLPVHLETPDPRHSPASPDPGALDLDDTDLAAMALPAVPIEPALGAKAFLVANPPHEASRQLVVDNCTASGQAILDDSSYSEIPNSSPTEASSPEIPDISNHPEIPDSSPDQVNCSGLLVSSPDVAEHEAPNAAQQTLPAESHEDEPPAHRGCGGHCANHERDSLRQQLDEQETRLSDLAHAEAAAVELESDLAAAREEVEITRAALREARENLKQVREDLGAQLDGRNTLVADQRLRIDDLLKQVYDRDTLIKVHSERIDDLIGQRVKLLDDLKAKDGALKAALTEIAALESFRDSFLGILEERDARLAEAQRRIDALMLAVRPRLGAPRDPEPGQPAGPEATAQRHLPAAGLAGAPAWHVNLASEPFNLPRVPKDWVGELSLRLLDEREASLKFKVDSEGAGAYCQFKADAVIDHSGADFVPGLANGLIQLMDYLFPHLAVSHPDHSADTGNMVGSEARP